MTREEAYRNVSIVYMMTRDPNRSAGPQTVLDWAPSTQDLHYAARQWMKDNDPRKEDDQ